MRALLVACLLASLALVALPAASAGGPIGPGEPQCMQVYRETHLGPVTIIQRDSCHAEYYLCDRTLGEAANAEHPLDCLVVS